MRIHLSNEKLPVTFSSQSQNYHILIAIEIETETETVAAEIAKTNKTEFLLNVIVTNSILYCIEQTICWVESKWNRARDKEIESFWFFEREKKKLINKINVRCVWIFVFILAHTFVCVCMSSTHLLFVWWHLSRKQRAVERMQERQESEKGKKWQGNK